MSEVLPSPGTMRPDLEQARCQHDVGTKAFTGKGAANRQMRQARIDVDNIHARMKELSEQTRSISGRLFYLALHKRTATGQLSVRWRKAGCARATHLSWSEMDGLFSRVPPVLAQWYRQADQLARQLNRDEQVARMVLKQAKDRLDEEQGQSR